MANVKQGWSKPVYEIFAEVREARYGQLKRGDEVDVEVSPENWHQARAEMIEQCATVFGIIAAGDRRARDQVHQLLQSSKSSTLEQLSLPGMDGSECAAHSTTTEEPAPTLTTT